MNEGMFPPDLIDVPSESDEQMMTWVGHLSELRRRLLKTFLFLVIAFACFYPFSEKILDILLKPLANAMQESGGSQRVIFTGLAEGFITHLKLAGLGAAAVTFPFFAFQIWQYISPGLYGSERALLRPLFFAVPFLFIAGGLFVFYIIMPLAFKFLLSFQQLSETGIHVPVVLEARLFEYISFISKLILAFGICFQLPVVLIVLARLGIISSHTLISARRYAVVLIFIVAAVATPPDIISQFGLAVPLLILYEGALRCIQRLEKKTN